jgi:glycine betaine catabolism B
MSFKFSRSHDISQEQNYYLNYEAGQHAIVDLVTKEDPEGPARAFTLASSPTEKDFILISTRIRDTSFKKKLATLDIGSYVKITAPLGKFVLHSDYSKPVVFLSGGLGVTPFRSMIKYATDRQLPLKITLFDSNRNQDNILYKEEFDEWANSNKNLKIIYTLPGDGGGGESGQRTQTAPSSASSSSNPLAVSSGNDWKGEIGFINKQMFSKYISTDELDD